MFDVGCSTFNLLIIMELPWIAQKLWLIPFLPLLAAGITALLKQKSRTAAWVLVVGAIAISFLLSLCALSTMMKHHVTREHALGQDVEQKGKAVRLHEGGTLSSVPQKP